MFYSQFILAKKGPLGTIWIAAHLERKLRKNQVADTDIGVSVDSILFPEMPIALRLSSHLLLGVVRIYSRKVNYLFDDCSEALLKVKQAFRSAAVDLPPEESTAPYHSITLPETFDLDDFELPDNEIFQGNYVDHHISSKDQITLQDTMEGVVYSTSKFGLDERFDDDDASGLDLDEELMVEKAVTVEHATGTSNSNVDSRTSVQDHASLKYDDNRDDLNVHVTTPASGNENQHIEEYDGDNEPVDYAQAPCTPGLWEEPNLSNIQETSACEDHHEPENHTITESAVKGNIENASHEHHNLFESHEKSQSHVATTEPMLMNNLGSTPLTESPVAEQHHNQFESLEKSLPHLTTEQMLMNNLGSTSFKESLVVDHQVSEPVIVVSDDPAKLEDLLNKNVRDKEPAVQTVDYNHEIRVEYQGNQENAWHFTKELESNTAKDNLVGSSQFQVFMQPKDSTVPFRLPHDSRASSGFPSLRPCVTLLNHETNGERPRATEAFDMNLPQIHLSELGPNNEVQVTSNISTRQMDNVIDRREVQVNNININSYASDFPAQVTSNISTRQVDNVIAREFQVNNININSYASDFTAQVAPSISTRQVDNVIAGEVRFNNINVNSYASDFSSQVASSISTRQVDNIIAREVQVNNINSYTTDFPAPEKLLSLPQGIPDVPRYMVPESTPTQKHIPTDYGGDAGTNMISGKKRSFTESSLTAQSLDLNHSSGFFTVTTNATENSVVNDDDLLSSILVGRKSSILKLKPTPPTLSTKRRRSTPKTGILKRKVVMDNNMVLHGDTIRQQLINTEDIRRLRKKAPCSHSEISMIAKQLWEDELFYEPIFTGLSNKLASLHNQLYDLSKFAVTHHDVSLQDGKDPKSISHNDEGNMQLERRTQNMGVSAEVIVSKEYGGEDNFEPVTRKDVPEEQPVEFPLVTDNRTLFDTNTTNLDYYSSQTQMHVTGDLTEPFSSEHDLLRQETAMEIDPKISDTVMPVEVESLESLTHANVVASDTCDMSAVGEVENTAQMGASLQMDHAPDVHSNDKLDLQYAAVDPIESSIVSESNNKSIESSIASEIKNDVPSVEEISEDKHEQDNEIRENEEQVVNEDEALALNARSNAQNLIYDGIFGEDFVAVEPYDGEVNLVTEGVSLDERENPGHQVTFDTTAMNLEDIPADNLVDDHEITQPVVEHDTDFLNFDDIDDDDADAGGDYAPDVEATRVIDNTGWSSRTKAVAKYLQIMFDKEGERGRNMIPVNNLLSGKTRKEASRMFFETLVLKTKDYIHVEQAEPFENINVFPRAKLLKSDF